MKIRKILSLILCLIMVGCVMAGCGNKAPEISRARILSDLENELKQQGNIFEIIEDFEYSTDEELTEADKELLRKKFDSVDAYNKISTTFKLLSYDMDIVGNFTMIYTYVNGSWIIPVSYATNADEWTYTPKNTVSTKQIFADLKATEFTGFKKGYVGTESNTSIKVTDRDTKMEINKDVVYFDITVKTDFAEYIIGATFTYYFKNGGWEVAEKDIQEESKWKINYNSDKVPTAPHEKTILEEVTTQTKFLTYVANKSYATSYEVRRIQDLAGVTTITFQYEFIAKYEHIGVTKYLVQVPYEWVDGEWSLGDTVVKITSVDVADILGTGTAKNGDYIEFTHIEKADKKDASQSDYIVGTYNKNMGKNAASTYNIKYQLTVPLRDNNWDFTSIVWETAGTESVEFTIKALSADVNLKNLVGDGNKFEKTADLIVDETEAPSVDASETSNENTVTSEPETTATTETSAAN